MFKNKKVEIEKIFIDNIGYLGLAIIFNNGKYIKLCPIDTSSEEELEFIYEDIKSLIVQRNNHRKRVREYSKNYDKTRQNKSHKKGKSG